MAVLSDSDRLLVVGELMHRAKSDFGTCVKADLLALVVAADTFADANAAAFNTSIPAGPRGKLTLQDKSLAYCLVVMKRAGLI